MAINRATPQQYFGNMPQQQVQPAMQTQMQPHYSPNNTYYGETVDKTVVIVGLIVFGVVAVFGLIAIIKK